MRIRIRRIKPRFYVLVGIVVLIPIIILLANMGGSKTAFVDWGIMSSSSKKDVVLLRSETVVKAESAGKVVYVAEEGQRVAQGDKVVEVYQAGYDQKSLDDYDALQKRFMSIRSAHWPILRMRSLPPLIKRSRESRIS